jgi:hypothetical protein
MRMAVLIDADNIPASHATRIFSHLSKLGTAVVRRLYGRPSSMTDWGMVARDELCEMRPLANVGPAKNGTDIALAIDAMDILHDSTVGAFCIVSNDRDFVPLAIRLRAAGKSVHAICLRSDERYPKAFDSVFELEHDDPIAEALLKITEGGAREVSLGEAGKLLRALLPNAIPTTGKSPLRKFLKDTGKVDFSGTGAAIKVRLTTRTR